MMKQIIYVLGNPIEKTDSLPVKLLPKLRKLFPRIDFIHYDPTEEIDYKSRELILIDSVYGTDKMIISNDLNQFTNSSRVSVHDYDLYLNLKLLKKLGRIKKFLLIGIPAGYKSDVALTKLRLILKN